MRFGNERQVVELPDFELRNEEDEGTANAGAMTFSDLQARDDNEESTNSFSNPLFDQEPPAIQQVCEANKEVENPLFGLVNDAQEQSGHILHKTETGAYFIASYVV